MLRWNTRTDAFDAGQWFHGKIYERRCDLSPDGALFIYFASKFNGRTIRDREYTYAWTAISKPPYFTALALWPKGDCWHGGGLFEGPKRVWLNHRPSVASPHPRHRPRGLRVIPNPEACGEDDPVWSRRMSRDGWTKISEGSYRYTRHGWRTEQAEEWDRPNSCRTVVLRRRLDAICFRRLGGPYVESFRLVLSGGETVPIQEATWADWDQQGRLVFARDGKLWSGSLEGEYLKEQELADFNSNVPQPCETPEDAKRWDW
jgi:hypothetical protein